MTRTRIRAGPRRDWWKSTEKKWHLLTRLWIVTLDSNLTFRLSRLSPAAVARWSGVSALIRWRGGSWKIWRASMNEGCSLWWRRWKLQFLGFERELVCGDWRTKNSSIINKCGKILVVSSFVEICFVFVSFFSCFINYYSASWINLFRLFWVFLLMCVIILYTLFSLLIFYQCSKSITSK